jgi:hypothetical protein
MVCDPIVAWVEFVRLLEVGERSIPAVLALIDSGRDHDRFRIIRQRATSDNQLVTGPIEITSVKISVVVIASQF